MGSWEPVDIDPTDRDGIGEEDDKNKNKFNDLILNLTPENLTQHSRIE